MNIRLKLFASLSEFLPPNAKDNIAEVELPEGITVAGVIDHFRLPIEQCHLVLLNGVFVVPERRASQEMVEGDTLALWPPVAGG
ncbi:MAG: MoaD/ThiS family protein [Gammaproteobacteria bacterium]